MSDPRDSVHDIAIPGQTRWALRIRGVDEHGTPRLLAIDWDGDTHMLNPSTGAVRRVAGSYLTGEVAIRVATGKRMTRADSAILTSYPPKIRWIAMAEDGGHPLTMFTDELMEDVDHV